MTQNNLLDIIIINWNSATQLRRCVDSILSSTIKIPGKLIIVDNCSTDRSLEGLNGIKGLQIIQPSENLGFGGGCNLGAQKAAGRWLAFLNADAFPASPLEMMACGGTVVLCEVTGIEEYAKDKYNALIVPMGDVEGAHNALKYLIENKEFCMQLSANEKFTSDKYGWVSTIDLLESA